MTLSFAVDADNDLYIGADDQLATVTGLLAVETAAAAAAQTKLDEMVLAIDQGLPYFEAVFVGSPDIPQFEAALRAALAAIADVEEVTTLTIRQSGDQLNYTAQILTPYGLGTVTNG